tara:strand:+ start:203 stop:460 length:258 start_codon:yes stop_codon:yes gene_type:complete
MERKQRFLNKKCMVVIMNIVVCRMMREYKLGKIYAKDAELQRRNEEPNVYGEALMNLDTGELWNLELTISPTYLLDYDNGGDLVI